MIRSANKSSQPDLTATEWNMILLALGTYHHHAGFRDLHDKVAVLAQTMGGVSHRAISAAEQTSGAGRTAVMG